jgi:hypothetical protein
MRSGVIGVRQLRIQRAAVAVIRQNQMEELDVLSHRGGTFSSRTPRRWYEQHAAPSATD